MRFVLKHWLHGLAALLLLGGLAQAAEEDAGDRIIVRWKATVGDAALREQSLRDVLARRSVRLQRLRDLGGRMEVLHVDDPARRSAALAALRANAAVEFAVEDRRVHAHAVTPNDPLFAQQWYLGSTEVAATRAAAAWDITRGGSPAASSVVVAIIDTGVRFDHPDLRRAAAGGKLLPGYDFVSGDKGGVFLTANDGDGWDADPSDPGDFLTAGDLQNELYKDRKCGGGTNHDQPTSSSWHGTRVAGLIGAGSDNAEGITGTAFHVRVLPVRALGKCGGYDSDVLAAMYWAAGLAIPTPLLAGAPDANATPAKIVNLSLGGTGACSDAYKQAVSDLAAAGVLIVASAGNEGAPVDSPANCPGVLGVAGLRQAGTKVGYSNLGPEVGIAAPAGNCVNTTGPCLYSLVTTSNTGTQAPAGSTYTSATSNPNVGTSFSAPLAAAAAGLMLAVNPRLTPSKLSSRVKETARAFPAAGSSGLPTCHVPASSTDVQDSECACTTQTCGAGMLDINGAVLAAQRPAALARVIGSPGPGRTLTLDGSASGAAEGRAVASWTWSMVDVSGGATTPVFATPTAAMTTMVSPALGSVTVRLTVVDGNGASDSADLTIEAPTSGGAVTAPSAPATVTPSSPSPDSGGGGAVDALLLAGLAAAWLRGVRRHGPQITLRHNPGA